MGLVLIDRCSPLTGGLLTNITCSYLQCYKHKFKAAVQCFDGMAMSMF